MSRLASPALLAWLQALAALVLHPALRARAWLPGSELLLVSLLLLWAIGLVMRAVAARPGARPGPWLAAAGALVLLAGLGLDGIRGQHGTLRLAVGHSATNFEESGGGGRSLGLRPLGFGIGVERATSDAVALVVPGRSAAVELRAGRSLAVGGFRIADPQAAATGDPARLRVAVSDGKSSQIVELAPGRPGRLGSLAVSLEQYFPDFALDERRQPFSRSLEPRNPAAILSVEREGRSYRAFAIQALPGVHRVEPLGLSFSLLDVEPAAGVTLRVHREPFALVVLLGLVALVVGAGAPLVRSAHAAPEAGSAADPLLGGAGLVACLLLSDGGSVLAWGLGVPLGLSLLAALLGSLLLAAQAVSGGVDVSRPARGALWLALAAGAAGVAVGGVRLAQTSPFGLAPARPLAGIALALLVLALALRARRPPAGGTPLALFWPAAQAAALVAAVGLGVLSFAGVGTYVTPATTAVAATALAGLAAAETTSLVAWRRFAFLIALLLLFVRPA